MSAVVWNLRCKSCGNIMVWHRREPEGTYFICLGCSEEFLHESGENDEPEDSNLINQFSPAR